MKKWICLLTALTLLVCIAGCQGKKSGNGFYSSSGKSISLNTSQKDLEKTLKKDDSQLSDTIILYDDSAVIVSYSDGKAVSIMLNSKSEYADYQGIKCGDSYAEVMKKYGEDSVQEAASQNSFYVQFDKNGKTLKKTDANAVYTISYMRQSPDTDVISNILIGLAAGKVEK